MRDQISHKLSHATAKPLPHVLPYDDKRHHRQACGNQPDPKPKAMAILLSHQLGANQHDDKTESTDMAAPCRPMRRGTAFQRPARRLRRCGAARAEAGSLPHWLPARRCKRSPCRVTATRPRDRAGRLATSSVPRTGQGPRQQPGWRPTIVRTWPPMRTTSRASTAWSPPARLVS